MHRFWSTRGHLAEGREWCARILAKERATERTLELTKTLSAAGNLAWHQTDYPAARSLLEESLAISRDLGDRGGIASSLNNLGNVAIEQGDYPTARTLYEESLSIRRELGDRRNIAAVLGNLGIIAYEQGDLTASRALSEEALTISRELGDQGRVADALNNLGNVAFDQGDIAAARALNEQSNVAGFDLPQTLMSGHKIVQSLDRLAHAVRAHRQRVDQIRVGRVEEHPGDGECEEDLLASSW